MADNLEIVHQAVSDRIRGLTEVADDLPVGRGAHLKSLILHTVGRFQQALTILDAEIIAISSSAAPEDVKRRLLVNSGKKIERLLPQLDVAYLVLSTYRRSIEREDVPIGLQHLIAVLISQVVQRPADPIIHLNPIRMYSTRDLVLTLDELLTKINGMQVGTDYADTHPIVFNLPALDPANALLSPILAHEVSHTAVEQNLMDALHALTGDSVKNKLAGHLSAAAVPATSQLADAWNARFRDWCGELLCDAVALAIAGPSFMFAFAAFAPPSNYARVGTHPQVRDRLRFHLKVLDRLGWTDFLSGRLPEIASWLREISGTPVLKGTAEESFLRDAISSIEPEIANVALGHVASPLSPSAIDAVLDSAVRDLGLGIPAVESGADLLDPWQVVLAGWVARLSGPTVSSASLIEAAEDRSFNLLLVKAIELSSVVSTWRAVERAS